MSSARDRVLDAAIALAARNGVPALTLDAVAAEAGVSKGGLLYHFASKEALLAGVAEAAIARWDADIAAATDGSASRGRAARAYVLAACGPDDDPSRELALLAAAAMDARSAETWRAAVTKWTAGDDAEDIDLLVARLAADGLWLARALGLYDLDRLRVAAVTARMVELTTATTS